MRLQSGQHNNDRPRLGVLCVAVFYTGMRRESVGTLRVHNLDDVCGLRGVKARVARLATSP